jgi:hypothetical protein
VEENKMNNYLYLVVDYLMNKDYYKMMMEDLLDKVVDPVVHLDKVVDLVVHSDKVFVMIVHRDKV